MTGPDALPKHIQLPFTNHTNSLLKRLRFEFLPHAGMFPAANVEIT